MAQIRLLSDMLVPFAVLLAALIISLWTTPFFVSTVATERNYLRANGNLEISNRLPKIYVEKQKAAAARAAPACQWAKPYEDRSRVVS